MPPDSRSAARVEEVEQCTRRRPWPSSSPRRGRGIKVPGMRSSIGFCLWWERSSAATDSLEADGDDVSQTVWLRLVEHLGALREPDALPGWIRTTTRNECLRRHRGARPGAPRRPAGRRRPRRGRRRPRGRRPAAAERRQALREALAELPAARRELLLLLLADPPLAYEVISERLGIPIGSIGPTRARASNSCEGPRPARARPGPGGRCRLMSDSNGIDDGVSVTTS